MNKVLPIIFLFVLFLSNQIHVQATNVSKIIIKVENEIITNFEIKNKILSTLIISNQQINQNNINGLKKQSLDALILLKLKKIELNKYNLVKNDKTVESNVNSYIKSISLNNKMDLEKIFQSNYIDFELFKQEIETEFMWQKLIYKIYSSKIDFDNKIIDQEVDQIINSQSDLEEFKLSEIEILTNNLQNENEEINKIQKQIKEIGFEMTAFKNSDSSSAINNGDIGWINSKSLSKDVYSQLAKLSIGEISEPIKRQNSILFLKIDDKKISKVKDIDKNKIRDNLISQKKNELFNLYSRSHLSKLKNTSLIEYK